MDRASEDESGKRLRYARKGEGKLTYPSTYAKCQFLHVFCDSFVCYILLLYFVVCGVDFITVL